MHLLWVIWIKSIIMYDIKQRIYYIESMHIYILSVLVKEWENGRRSFRLKVDWGNGGDLLEYLWWDIIMNILGYGLD